METWKIEADRGLHDLSRHKPRAALQHLSEALKLCPERRASELARILFYLGMTMRKLGLANPALRSWNAAQRLEKRGFGRKMLDRYANAYGMEKQNSADEDDWQAFRSVQVRRYLRTRKGQRFASGAEATLLHELVRMHWEDLKGSCPLATMSSADKCDLFRSVKVEFPVFVSTGDPIPVSFASGKRVTFDDRCPCGSGRPFRVCCGRTQGMEELNTGT